jgi:hypothetical protein
VQQFLANAQIRAFQDCRITIFIEPKLEYSFPDVVLVAWRPSITRNWRPERKNLDRHDFRVLQHLVSSGGRRDIDLKALFGSNIRKRLANLQGAGLVSNRGSRWQAKPLSSIFAAVAIVAIEAKMKNLNVAIQQAFLNTWFASESYVLVPSVRRASQSVMTASIRGIGILNANSRLSFARAAFRPRSYASWQLNEWAWRASLANN